MPIRFSAFRRVFAPHWAITLATLVLLALFVSLGRWQWHRGEAKQAVWAEYAKDSAPVVLGSRDFDSIPRFGRISISGEFFHRPQFLLDNRSHNGQPGWEVLTPFELDDGRWILVNRGWIPMPNGDRRKLPYPMLPAGQHSVITGRIDELPSGGLAMGHAAPYPAESWLKITSFPTHEELAASMGRSIDRRILLLDANDGYDPAFVREWSPPGLSPDRHFSYAIQWWGFALVLLVLYCGLNFRKVP
jgi:cytochrome oxidase assembly protein ShyY1